MARGEYSVISEVTEDRFGEAESLDEAVRIARDVVREGRAGEPVSIERGGRVVRQLVLTPEGVIEEAPGAEDRAVAVLLPRRVTE
jgi:hypothetical protein